LPKTLSRLRIGTLGTPLFSTYSFSMLGVFEQVTGIKAPSTPITPELYKRYGYPFFKLYEEKSGVKGDFQGLKSVGALDQQKGVKRARDEFLRFPIVELNTVDKQRRFLPVSEIEATVKKLNIVAGF
jgi:hypothetical protein